MSAFYGGAGGAGSVAFGSASYGAQLVPIPSCGPPFISNSGYVTPIVFGVSQVEQFSVEAVGGGIDGSGDASLGGFQVFDAAGNLLSNAKVAVTDTVPEPSALFPLFASLGALLLSRRRVR